jgi:hypothetical protein
MICDHIVFSVPSHQIREKLINEGSNLTLEKCIDLSRTYALSQTQLRDISGQAKSINAVKKSSAATAAASFKKFWMQSRKTDGSKHSTRTNQRVPTGNTNNCNNCATYHLKRDTYPAKGQKCLFCTKFNHFAKVCRKRKQGLGCKNVNEATHINTNDIYNQQ